jgi:hypothetical protein
MIADDLFALAHEIACNTTGFLDRQGPGKDKGNGATNAYLAVLNQAALARWPDTCRQQEPVANGIGYSFDFYIPAEGTAVEVALSLRNVVTEFEKDIFKAILAKDGGKKLERLLLLGKHGAVLRCQGPGPQAIMAWVKRTQGITVEIKDLGQALSQSATS